MFCSAEFHHRRLPQTSLAWPNRRYLHLEPQSDCARKKSRQLLRTVLYFFCCQRRVRPSHVPSCPTQLQLAAVSQLRPRQDSRGPPSRRSPRSISPRTSAQQLKRAFGQEDGVCRWESCTLCSKAKTARVLSESEESTRVKISLTMASASRVSG